MALDPSEVNEDGIHIGFTRPPGVENAQPGAELVLEDDEDEDENEDVRVQKAVGTETVPTAAVRRGKTR